MERAMEQVLGMLSNWFLRNEMMVIATETEWWYAVTEGILFCTFREYAESKIYL